MGKEGDVILVESDTKSIIIDRIISLHGGAKNIGGSSEDILRDLQTRQLTLDDLNARVQECAEWQRQLGRLLMSPGIAQRTPEWYEARMQLITASDVAQALGRAKFGNQKQFFQKKCGMPEEQVPFDASIPPLKWGVMYEPVAQSIYAATNGGMGVYEFGLLKHPDVAHLGASPDGITELGVMLEIKCPWKRRIQEGQVPLQYYYQMQMQLDVCNLDECDFYECEFEEVDGPEDPRWKEKDDRINRGVFAEIVSQEGQSIYVYPALGMSARESEIWVSAATDSACAATRGDSYLRPRWWTLRKSSTVRIQRDLQFVAETIRGTEDVWNRVCAYRRDRELYLREIGAPTPTKPGASKRAKATKVILPFQTTEEDMMRNPSTV